MTIYKIKFKRTKESEWESGIRIEKSTTGDLFLDKDGNILPESKEGWIVWEAKDLLHHFCIDLTSILKD